MRVLAVAQGLHGADPRPAWEETHLRGRNLGRDPAAPSP